MKLFINRKIKILFGSILSCAAGFTLISALMAVFKVKNASFYIFICGLCMAAAILLFCYGYFRDQHKMMENAIRTPPFNKSMALGYTERGKKSK